MTPLNLFKIGHIAAGTVALLAFWLPLVAKKGGSVHRRAGWLYACAMWLVAFTAFGMCALRLVDKDASNDVGAFFLAFVGLLAANGAATAIRVLRTKTRTTAHTNAFDLGSSALLLGASLAVAVLGVRRGAALFVALGALGAFLAIAQLRFWLRPPTTKMQWWYEHMGNMLTACIATVTAFMVVNVPRLGLASYALFFWIAPGLLGGIGISAWRRHYRRKFEAPTQGRAP